MLTGLKVETGAGAILSAAHRSADGKLHGHTWEIEAYWTGTPCAVEMQAALINWVSTYDHGLLPDELSRGEWIAAAILKDLGCCRVEVRRPAERIYARAAAA